MAELGPQLQGGLFHLVDMITITLEEICPQWFRVREF